MTLRGGRLRHLVEIQSATETQTTSGEVSRAWATSKKVWASVQPLSGREFIQGQQVNADITHKCVMRYTSGVTPKMRLIHNARTLEIEHVINHDERDERLELLCKEAV